MNQGITILFAASFLSCAMFCTGEAPAMQISQWNTLSDTQKDGFDYVLIAGTVKNLQANGHPNQVKTVLDLFFNKDSNIRTGKQEFYNNIAKAEQINASLPAGSNLLQVEDAFQAALNDHGVNISRQDLLTIGQTYDLNASAKSSPAATH